MSKAEASLPREKPQRIADELRELIISGQLAEGESLGLEADLVERFQVSRPSLREALRILETEGLITVVRGWRGGIIVHLPSERAIARAASAVLRSRQVSIDDVFEARTLLEPIAARSIAAMPRRLAPIGELMALIGAAEEAVGDVRAYAEASAAFHERLVALAGNQTLSLLTEMLNELSSQVTDDRLRRASDVADSEKSQEVGIRAHRRLLQLLEVGDESAVEEHWRSHMQAVAKVMLKEQSSAVVNLLP